MLILALAEFSCQILEQISKRYVVPSTEHQALKLVAESLLFLMSEGQASAFAAHLAFYDLPALAFLSVLEEKFTFVNRHKSI